MKKLILVIDDELTTCVLLENFLKKEYDVVTVSSALEALKITRRNKTYRFFKAYPRYYVIR